jgi:tripartite-type tricarboxylate transporter receptor subunit TctC
MAPQRKIYLRKGKHWGAPDFVSVPNRAIKGINAEGRTMKLSFTIALAMLASGLAPLPAEAQYPDRPVKVIVPYAPGGATDIVARVLAEQLRVELGQSFYVENKPGANGIIAIEAMVRAGGDGYTVMVGNVSTNAITPILYADKLNIDYRRDVVPVARLVDIPEFLLLATKNFAPRTAKDFIEYVKAHPGEVNYGSVGVGSYPDYDMALFGLRAGGLKMLGVPNRSGATGVINDMLGGSTQAAFLNVASTAGLVQSGQLHPAALVNRTRLPAYPNVPTMQEVGFGDVGTLAWQAMFAPASTPPDVLETLQRAVTEAMQAPSVKSAFDKQNFNIVPTRSLDEAKAWLDADMKHWKTITDEVKLD